MKTSKFWLIFSVHPLLLLGLSFWLGDFRFFSWVMEDRQSKRSSRTSIIKGLNASIRPMNIQMDNHLVIGGTRHYHQETNCKSPTIVDCYNIMNHYASSTSGSNSFGSRGAGLSLSPLSAIENLETPPVKSPQIYGTPMKVDEEVIVMDGILISSIHGEAKTVRSPLDSGSGGGGKNQYRSDICRYWEDSGSCRFGNKCQVSYFVPTVLIWSELLSLQIYWPFVYYLKDTLPLPWDLIANIRQMDKKNIYYFKEWYD